MRPVRRFFERLQDSMSRFMYGRNGVDQLGHFTYLAGLVLFIINLFVRNSILSLVILAVWGWSLFRAYSRNLIKRQKENDAWMRFTGSIGKSFRLSKRMWKDRKEL